MSIIRRGLGSRPSFDSNGQTKKASLGGGGGRKEGSLPETYYRVNSLDKKRIALIVEELGHSRGGVEDPFQGLVTRFDVLLAQGVPRQDGRQALGLVAQLQGMGIRTG